MSKQSPNQVPKSNWQHNANLHFVSNGKIVKTILENKPYKVCGAKKKELSRTNHYKYGKLVVVSVQASNQLEQKGI